MKPEVSQKNNTNVLFWPLFWTGFRDAAVGPVWMLGASMMGFGALVRAKGLSWVDALFSNFTAFPLKKID